MKIRVIDLLNKIANGEEVPKKIRVGNSAFELSLVEMNGSKHYSGNTDSVLNNVMGMAKLNEEVEIIEDKPFNERVEEIYNRNIKYIYGEEDKKIEKLGLTYLKDDDRNEIINKINEIIDYINKVDKDV